MTRDFRTSHDDDEATSPTRALATERRVSRRERETAARASSSDRPTASPKWTTTTRRRVRLDARRSTGAREKYCRVRYALDANRLDAR
tara:strand:+ start:993 stop:1256 length:264 start_codon:yes stop_codon:yes gene_type:complete